ncbi:hypothetical protein DFH07DRAFT_1057672 [Mycena maculata]|uniref:Ribonuclease H1 N-terminal domain-containing protein n=1 Tax=Mycena maculata TaxID=230809 RepID=A0AAD7NQB6_9AGAR|nr:hypothetical protein DFH07DRAFT_1057672 [Mycena maculata]
MSPLTPAQVAELLTARNGEPEHARLSPEDLERLTAHLTETQLEQVARRVGLHELAPDLPQRLHKIILAAQRIARDAPPEYDDELNTLIRNFDTSLLSERETAATPPPSSPEPPSTPVQQRISKSSPSTAHMVGRGREYIVQSPVQGTARVFNWFDAATLTQGIPGASVLKAGSSRRSRKPRAGAFAVFFGGAVGVFEKWEDVQRVIAGHGLAIYCGFPDVLAATTALDYARSKGWTADSELPSTVSTPYPVPSLEPNPLSSSALGSGVWYVVCCGITPGVYCSYLECSLNVSGVRGALFNTFTTLEEAQEAFKDASSRGLTKFLRRLGKTVVTSPK